MVCSIHFKFAQFYISNNFILLSHAETNSDYDCVGWTETNFTRGSYNFITPACVPKESSSWQWHSTGPTTPTTLLVVCQIPKNRLFNLSKSAIDFLESRKEIPYSFCKPVINASESNHELVEWQCQIPQNIKVSILN